MTEFDATAQPQVSIAYQCTEAEYVLARRRVLRGSGRFIGMVVLAAVYALFVLVYSLLVRSAGLKAVMVLLAVLMVANVGMRYFVFPLRDYRKDPAEHGNYNYLFTPQGLQVQVQGGESAVVWSFYGEVWETKELFLLRSKNKRFFTAVLKRGFEAPGSLEAFKALLPASLPVLQK